MVILVSEKTFKNLWFRNINESITYINDTTMCIRAGIVIYWELYT